MRGRWDRVAPATGLVAIVVIIVAFAVGGETPDAGASGAEVRSFYTDNETEIGIGAVALALGAIFWAFFASALVGRLRRAGQGHGLATVVIVGAALLSTGIAIFAGLSFTLSDNADKLDPVALQAINSLSSDLFFPLAVGTALLAWGLALTILLAGGLPRWLGWVALVIAIVAVTPLGFFAFLALGLWTAVTSVLMLARPEPLPVAPAGGPGVH